MKYRVPIDFIVKATTPEEAKIRIEEFLLHAVSEFRLAFDILEYEAPFGYPIEPESENDQNQQTS